MKLLRKFSLLVLYSTLIAGELNAQTTNTPHPDNEPWDLRQCVDYAIKNNISVRQSDVQKRMSDLVFEQNKKTRIPNASFSTNTGYQFGRSIDPTTNLFTNQQLLFQGYQFNTDMTIYNWGRINNNITASRLGAEAAAADVEKNRNDISLNVATGYLAALLSKVQIDIVQVQLQQSQNQLADTRKRVEAGTVPELNAVDLEAQVARDSSTLITAQGNFELNLLSLKALLNMDAASPFSIAVPPVDQIPVDPISELQPALVFDLAMKNQPAQKANELRRQSLEYSAKAARSLLYPTFSAFGGLASNFANSNLKTTSVDFLGYNPPRPYSSVVDVNGVLTPVQTPNFKVTQAKKTPGEMWSDWGSQMSNNFRQNLGIAISVPIFNGYQARTGYQRSKLNVESQNLVIEQANQKLKQDIYNAYTNAVTALQKYNSANTSRNAAQRAYDFASRRYELGLLSTLELITSQTNLTRAKIDVANAQFDYVFRMKVLEFYKGMGIKL
ncbi:TolC family protein [Flavihumibacter profundi]|uniref:TolC family protein n=1 Tax=Flavihumibacter profundi TaxID=2716883 RepID=UPI001CC81656|nr:TolC family protein [Flavihumibacter profundi]MBZ5858047.1 TolC family protein [Flavihumibacter profundi]